MKCPFCGNLGDKVVDSREGKEGNSIRRRRECLGCGKRYTSREHIEEIEYRVLKKDGRPEPFQRQKLIGGLVRACEKRPVSVQQLEGIADRSESELQDRPDREIRTTDIGARIMEELLRIDQSHHIAGLRLNAWVSVILFVASSAFFLWWQVLGRGGSDGAGPPKVKPLPQPDPSRPKMAVPRGRVR